MPAFSIGQPSILINFWPIGPICPHYATWCRVAHKGVGQASKFGTPPPHPHEKYCFGKGWRVRGVPTEPIRMAVKSRLRYSARSIPLGHPPPRGEGCSTDYRFSLQQLPKKGHFLKEMHQFFYHSKKSPNFFSRLRRYTAATPRVRYRISGFWDSALIPKPAPPPSAL